MQDYRRVRISSQTANPPILRLRRMCPTVIRWDGGTERVGVGAGEGRENNGIIIRQFYFTEIYQAPIQHFTTKGLVSLSLFCRTVWAPILGTFKHIPICYDKDIPWRFFGIRIRTAAENPHIVSQVSCTLNIDTILILTSSVHVQ